MPTKMIRVVTVTGADDSTSIDEMFRVQEQFPMVEWGILVSDSRMGSYRFPSMNWISALSDRYRESPTLKLSMHICGRWVREIFTQGIASLFEYLPMSIFKRIQFNFHAQAHQVNLSPAIELFKSKFLPYELIFQFDGINDLHSIFFKHLGIPIYPLFDKSGGAGILPDSWPTAEGYSGYAGGLSPDNLLYELMQIDHARAGHEIWIDAETKLRSENDSVFDMEKVRSFLTVAKDWTL